MRSRHQENGRKFDAGRDRDHKIRQLRIKQKLKEGCRDSIVMSRQSLMSRQRIEVATREAPWSYDRFEKMKLL